jgi:hypothetical protein
MNSNKINISEILNKAWKLTSQNLTILLGLQISFFTFFILLTLLISGTKDSLPLMSFFFNAVNFILQVIFTLGMIRICLKIIDQEEVKFRDIIPNFQHSVRYVSASLFIAIIALMIFFSIFSLFTMANSNFMQNEYNKYILGFFVAIPILIIALRFQFYSYIIVDRNRSTFSSLLRSYLITKEHLGTLVVLILLLILINVLGALLLLIGLLFSIPVSMFIMALVYRELYKGAEYILDGDESDKPMDI